MKFAKFSLAILSVFAIYSIAVLVPSLDIDLFGYNIQSSDLKLHEYCLPTGDTESEETEDSILEEEVRRYCLAPREYSFANGVTFGERNKLRFEFAGLSDLVNAEENGISQEEVNNILVSTMEIVRQRMEYSGVSDYDINAVHDNNGSYFLEVDVPKSDQGYEAVVGTVARQNALTLYADIDGYVPAEASDDQGFNFLEGKEIPSSLNLDDVEDVDVYYESLVGSYVLNLSFSEQTEDALRQIDSASLNSQIENNLRGIWLVQDGFPILIQYGPIVQPSFQGDIINTNLTFGSFFGQTDEIRARALASTIITEELPYNLTQVDVYELPPTIGSNNVQLAKVLIPGSLLLIAIVTYAIFRKQSYYPILMINIAVLFTLAIIKMFNPLGIVLSTEFIIGLLLSVLITTFMFKRLLVSDIDLKNLRDYQNDFRKYVLLLVLCMSVVSILANTSQIIDSRFEIIINTIFISALSIFITFETAPRAISNFIKK